MHAEALAKLHEIGAYFRRAGKRDRAEALAIACSDHVASKVAATPPSPSGSTVIAMQAGAS